MHAEITSPSPQSVRGEAHSEHVAYLRNWSKHRPLVGMPTSSFSVSISFRSCESNADQCSVGSDTPMDQTAENSRARSVA